jgi:hypothetical protein
MRWASCSRISNLGTYRLTMGRRTVVRPVTAAWFFEIPNNTKAKSLKLTPLVLACAFVISSTFAFAHPLRHKSGVGIQHMYRARVGSGILHPNYANPNTNADGLSNLRRTLNYGGSSPGTTCYRNCVPRDRDDWPAKMLLD